MFCSSHTYSHHHSQVVVVAVSSQTCVIFQCYFSIFKQFALIKNATRWGVSEMESVTAKSDVMREPWNRLLCLFNTPTRCDESFLTKSDKRKEIFHELQFTPCPQMCECMSKHQVRLLQLTWRGEIIYIKKFLGVYKARLLVNNQSTANFVI